MFKRRAIRNCHIQAAVLSSCPHPHHVLFLSIAVFCFGETHCWELEEQIGDIRECSVQHLALGYQLRDKRVWKFSLPFVMPSLSSWQCSPIARLSTCDDSIRSPASFRLPSFVPSVCGQPVGHWQPLSQVPERPSLAPRWSLRSWLSHGILHRQRRLQTWVVPVETSSSSRMAEILETYCLIHSAPLSWASGTIMSSR